VNTCGKIQSLGPLFKSGAGGRPGRGAGTLGRSLLVWIVRLAAVDCAAQVG